MIPKSPSSFREPTGLISVARVFRRQQNMFEASNRLLNRVESENLRKSYATVEIETINRMWSQIEDLHLRRAELNADQSEYDYDRFLEYDDQVQSTLIKLNEHIETDRLVPSYRKSHYRNSMMTTANGCN